MKEQFQSFTQLCTRSLADDPALRLEVGHELEGHLEDACAEERSEGKSESEAEDQAKKRFGEPEELAQSLLDANRRKLKLRARLRLAAKIALIPAILIGLALCIDLRTLAGFVFLGDSDQFSIFQTVIDWETRHLSAQDKQFISRYFGAHSDFGKEQYESSPESKLFTANYLLTLFETLKIRPTAERQAELQRVITQGRRIDPDNALYDYIEANSILLSALQWDKSDNPYSPEFSPIPRILDRQALDHAMKLYRSGLEKPFIKTYAMGITVEIERLINPSDDFLGLLEKISIRVNSRFHSLPMANTLFRASIFYAKILKQEEKTVEATQYLHSWRQFLPQLLTYNANALIEILVYYNGLKIYRNAAQQFGDMEEAKKLEIILADLEDWKRKAGSNSENIRNYGGILVNLLLPALQEDIPIHEFEPERKLTYLLGDLTAFAILSLLLAVLIVIFGIGVLAPYSVGYRPFLLLLPLKSYQRILLFGVLIPIGIFLLYTHFDILGGRDLSIQRNLLRWGLGVIGIVFVFPFVFGATFMRELKKQGKRLGFQKGRLPFATACLNMLCAFTALLFITGCVLRPLLAWECRRYIARDKLFNTDFGFTQVENQVVKQLKTKLADAIAAADQKP